MKVTVRRALAGGMIAILTEPGVIVLTHHNTWWAVGDGILAGILAAVLISDKAPR